MPSASTRGNTTGRCRLCDTDSILSFSHVLPEFMYVPTYGTTGRFISALRVPKPTARPFEKGFRQYLLCSACETRLSKWEKYAAELLRAVPDPPEGLNGLARPDYDYAVLKLFGLSLIWRAHESSLPVFREVDIGEHAEAIRALLVEKNPGDPTVYPLGLQRLVGSSIREMVIVPPMLTEVNGVPAWLMQAFGFNWIFVMSGQATSLDVDLPFVGFQDQLIIPVKRTTDSELLAPVHDIRRDVEKARRLPRPEQHGG